MTLRYYSSIASDATLQATITAGQTTMIVSTVTGWPLTYPFTIALDYGTGLEELVDVTNVSGFTVTMTRGVDSTSAVGHNLGATIRHVVIARDMRETNVHVNATVAHGSNGNVVGATDLSAAIAAIPPVLPWTTYPIAVNSAIVNRGQYMVTTSSPWILTTPLVPNQGDEIRIFDVSGQAATNNITINTNGAPFQGTVQNLVLAYNYVSVTLVYTGASYGWKVA